MSLFLRFVSHEDQDGKPDSALEGPRGPCTPSAPPPYLCTLLGSIARPLSNLAMHDGFAWEFDRTCWDASCLDPGGEGRRPRLGKLSQEEPMVKLVSNRNPTAVDLEIRQRPGLSLQRRYRTLLGMHRFFASDPGGRRWRKHASRLSVSPLPNFVSTRTHGFMSWACGKAEAGSDDLYDGS